MIDSIIDLYEQDGRLFAAIQNADDSRELACIQLADDDDSDELTDFDNLDGSNDE